ncbi:MSIR6 protein, partial [Acromyrmex charruanus]
MVECKKAQPKEVMLPANLAKTRAASRGAYGDVMEIFVVFAGFPAAAYAAYAAGRGYSGYPSFGLPYPTGNHLSLNHLNHHNAAHIAPLNLNLNLIQAQPAPHHNPPTPTPLFYHPNLDLYNAMPLRMAGKLCGPTSSKASPASTPIPLGTAKHKILKRVPAVYYHGTGSENASRAYTEAPMQHVQRNALRKKLDLTNGQLTPNNNTPLLTQALSVMNNYQAAAAQAGFPPASPHAAGGHAAAADSAVASYVQAAASPQPPTTAFPAIAVSRAPLNYSPVSPFNAPPFFFIGSGPSR